MRKHYRPGRFIAAGPCSQATQPSKLNPRPALPAYLADSHKGLKELTLLDLFEYFYQLKMYRLRVVQLEMIWCKQSRVRIDMTQMFQSRIGGISLLDHQKRTPPSRIKLCFFFGFIHDHHRFFFIIIKGRLLQEFPLRDLLIVIVFDYPWRTRN
jgi:hypothetical protein